MDLDRNCKLIIFEGPDCAGKTTLMNKYKSAMNCIDIHHGPYIGSSSAELVRTYEDSMRKLERGNTVLMDRCWLSEPIYGNAFRGGQTRISLEDQAHLEGLASIYDCGVVLCLPPWDTVKAQWLLRKGADKEAEYLDKIDQLATVYAQYTILEDATTLPVTRYDYTTGTYSVIDRTI